MKTYLTEKVDEEEETRAPTREDWDNFAIFITWRLLPLRIEQYYWHFLSLGNKALIAKAKDESSRYELYHKHTMRACHEFIRYMVDNNLITAIKFKNSDLMNERNPKT